MEIVALAGGVGAARFLTGLVRKVDPGRLTVVANTGDDLVLHGLRISPDLDTLTYTLGGGVDPEQGWGRSGDTFAVSRELRDRYGRPDWFTLGDRDLATHLVRTEIIHDGGTLSEATAAVAAAWGLPFALLPMTDDPVATRIRTTDGRDLHFQEWWIGEGAAPDVAEVRLAGAEQARAARMPGTARIVPRDTTGLEGQSSTASAASMASSTPGAALEGRPVVGVSPIVGGKAVRGMADRLLPAAGAATSAVGVAGLYADVLDGWVIDHADADAAPALEDRGLRVAVTDTIMRTPEVAADLARTVLSLC